MDYRGINDETGDADEQSYAFFFLDGREFGIDVQCVHETIRFQSNLIHMPCSMDVVDGLINLRGNIIPIINLRTRFSIAPRPAMPENRIAVTRFNGHFFGLLFDEISEVVRIRKSQINPIETSETDPELCDHGVVSLDGGTRIVQLLDLERLFHKYNLPQIDSNLGKTEIFRPLKQNITFMLDRQEYAVDVHAIKEIIKVPEIRSKVLVHDAIKGVVALRGELISIIGLRDYFGLPEQETSPAARIIILQGELACGILVDAIQEVVHYEEDRLLPIPAFQEGQESFEGIVALGAERDIIKLAPDRLFNEALCRQIKGNARMHLEEAATAPNTAHSDEGCAALADRVLISFRLGGIFGFDITRFREIINYTDNILSLPGRKTHYEGVLNLRGNAVPIINLRRYYGMDEYPDINEAKIIILDIAGKTFGIIVDAIIEIVKPDRSEIVQLPNMPTETLGGVAQNHIQDAYRFTSAAQQNKVILIYNIEKMINEIELPPHQEPAPPDTDLEAEAPMPLAAGM